MKVIFFFFLISISFGYTTYSIAQDFNYDSLMTESKPKKVPKDEGWLQTGVGISRVSSDNGNLRLAYSIIGNYGSTSFWQGGLQLDQALLSSDQIVTVFGGKGISKVRRLGRVAVAGGPSVLLIHDLQRNRENWIPAVGAVGTVHANITPLKSFGMGLDIILGINTDHSHIGFRYVLVFEGYK